MQTCDMHMWIPHSRQYVGEVSISLDPQGLLQLWSPELCQAPATITFCSLISSKTGTFASTQPKGIQPQPIRTAGAMPAPSNR